LQLQACWPHPGLQRCGKLKFDHMPAVTPLLLATAATCIANIPTVIVVGNNLEVSLLEHWFVCNFNCVGRIRGCNAAASSSDHMSAVTPLSLAASDSSNLHCRVFNPCLLLATS
jgi:hypothetical protein